jgi:signal transduction histidine kinase
LNAKDLEREATELTYMKSESFEFLAHDINNIFNNVGSSAELCKIFLDNTSKLSNVYEQLDIIAGQITRGIKLISNARYLFQKSKLGMEKKQINIIKPLQQAIKFVQKNFRDKELNITVNPFDDKIIVEVDDLIVEVFENLLVNAVLHNLNSTIDITVQIIQELKGNQKYIKIQFIDNGIGIADDRKKRLFESSFIKDNHGKGMGFGLSLVKEIVDSYGGEIWVEDRIKGDYNQGSNFIILLKKFA